MKQERLRSLDVLRGSAVMLIILFHAAIYNFANIHKLDFTNPPIIIIIMSFMALWGGIFIMYSMVVNTLMLRKRRQEHKKANIFLHLTYVSGIYLLIHYLLNIFLGRWNVDFVNNQPDMTVVASSIRNLSLQFPHLTKLFEGSSLSTIALNLLILSWILYLLFRNNGEERKNRNYLILGGIGTSIMLLSFIRVHLYELFTQALTAKNHFLSIIYSFVLANPYPLLPYLAYGFFGALIGLMLYDQRKDLLKKIILPVGFLFLVFGIVGMMNFEKTISKPDLFWYFKTNFELGVFMLMIPSTYLALENKKKILDNLAFLQRFSRISLTIYLLETLLSELLRLLLNPLVSGWNETINGCLLFGALNIIIWIIITYTWSKKDFKYSLEYFWVRLFKKIGKESTKMELPKKEP